MSVPRLHVPGLRYQFMELDGSIENGWFEFLLKTKLECKLLLCNELWS